MLKINFNIAEQVIVNFIRDAVYKNNFKKGIIGVSGGLDSSVVLYLSQKALGSENTFALLLPYKLSSEDSLKHGRMICNLLRVQYETIDISPSVSAYFDRFPTKDRILIGNKCARERMSVLYDYSMRKKSLVIGTSNKSELLIGYTTLFGDSAAAFLPIGDLYKTQLYDFARYLQVPKEIINKKPSADLWKDQTDEGEIGISYQELDELLYNLVDLRKKSQEIIKLGFSKPMIQKVQGLIMSTQYKRTMPPIAKLQTRTVGLDFRYLRDWNK